MIKMNKSVLWGILFSLFIIFTLTSCEEDPYPDYSRLTAPTGVSGSVVSNGIRLSWNTVDDAKFYMICRASSLNGSKVMLSYIGDGGYIYNNNVIDTNPLDGNNYYFIYACKSLNIQSPASTPIYIQYVSGNNNPGGENENKIKAPTNVRAVQNGKTIVLTWDAVDGASRYEIFHASSANGSYSSYGYWTNNRYIDEVVLVTNNYYKVKAIGSTTSEFSDYAYCKYSDNSGSQKPSVPTGLKAVQSGESIVVSWNSVANTYYYRLWYSTPYGTENFTNVYAPTTTAVFDRYMDDGTYQFWIQALNSNYEESDKSSKVYCTYKSNSAGGDQGGDNPSKLETPKNIEAYSSSYFVQVSVDEVPLAYEYELYRSRSASSGYTKISASGGSTASKRYVLTDSNPLSGTTYYKVKAKALSYLGIANSDFSSYVKVVR
ncbi:MAG: hypothetical protein E7083_00565 [Bacteroidales bacterium]|nr:hypothetical protein [Bacteroidales bacterium]